MKARTAIDGRPLLAGVRKPEVVLPTATEDENGAGKVQLGAAAVYFDASSRFFQWGGLTIYRTDVAGDSDRDSIKIFAAQPFYFFQLGEGLYLRGAPIWGWLYDESRRRKFLAERKGLEKVVKKGDTLAQIDDADSCQWHGVPSSSSARATSTSTFAQRF